MLGIKSPSQEKPRLNRPSAVLSHDEQLQLSGNQAGVREPNQFAGSKTLQTNDLEHAVAEINDTKPGARHWLLNALVRAHAVGAEKLEPSRMLTLDQAWATATHALGWSEAQVAEVVGKQLRLKSADLDVCQPSALKLVPERLIRQYAVLPLRQNNHAIFVATSDPTNLDCEQTLQFASGRTPVFEVAGPVAIRAALAQRFASDDVVQELLHRLDPGAGDVRVVDDTEPEAMRAEELDATPIVQLVNTVLHEAARRNASDVHIEPGPQGGMVRLRIDGVLHPLVTIPLAVLSRVVSRLKVMARLDIADRVRPQDGRARVEIDGRNYDLRLSTIPLRDCEKAVVRLLDSSRSVQLAELRFPPLERERFQQLLGQRDGIVLVTGPTGSGKTTTLYAALRQLHTGKLNISTVEDPIEYELPGVAQMQVDAKRGVTFASALRALLRQDPDVILVGEIRDLETATIAVQASMTGHLVLATLHTNDAASAPQRLLDLGLDAPTLAASLRGVIAQRLLRQPCPRCNARGCTHCDQTGYRGRLPVMEILTMTPPLQRELARGADVTRFAELAAREGMRTMSSVALDRVRSGETTIEEVERVLGDPRATTATSAPSGLAAPRRALVTDDDPENRFLARTLLESMGFAVTEAEDGLMALDAVAADPGLNLIMLDLDMPRLDGRDTLRRLKANHSTAAVPVVVLTGSESSVDELHAMDHGAEDYIRKPLDPTRFLARVRAVMRRTGGAV
jgi:type II secretory ATPase GspE/PulE/Tfp pilus assembly ATPase PilB-like protein/ActR/RegA family two-component response regulator